ncbi:MAG: response regulator [FCB group bacterium]|nr:response regulator [FCB group bacterium]
MNNNQNTTNIVVVDDEKYICNIIVEALSAEKYHVESFSHPESAIKYIKENPVDLVLTDLVMGEYSGVHIFDITRSYHKDAIVILMTAFPTVETAISVLKKGAYDFLVKPFKLNLLRATIKRGLEHQKLVRDNLHLKEQVAFLKVINAGVTGEDIESFLKLVVNSSKKELSAQAVSILEIDPGSKKVIRAVYDTENDDFLEEILDESALLNFSYTKSSKPNISKEQIDWQGENVTRIFISQPIFIRRKLYGVINLLIMSHFDELTKGQLDILSVLTNSAASAVENYHLYDDLENSYLQAIRALANAIEARDSYTAGHTDRVCQLAELIAHQLNWDKKQIDNLVMGCTLHDIGKIGVPDSILNKPTKLTKKERQKMISHPQLGLKIIRGIELFKPAIPFIIAHHEWYDGSGYPKKLKGEAIPVEGRLLAVADTFDAIMSDRPYRKGRSLEVAISELMKFRGIQFDSHLVDAFIEVIRQGKIDFKKMYKRDENITFLERYAAIEKVPV